MNRHQAVSYRRSSSFLREDPNPQAITKNQLLPSNRKPNITMRNTILSTGLAALLPATAFAALPTPVHQWTFDTDGSDSGSGGIEYQGAPQGDCRFETGSGSITLELPPDLSMEVNLDTGTGSLDVGYDVAGTVSRKEVRGVIGDGSHGSIRAHTGAGSIHLVRH